MSAEHLYGQIDEDLVDPERVRLARETFEFCLKKYGSGGRKIKLLWMKEGSDHFGIAKIREVIREAFGGQKTDSLERGYEVRDEEVDGFVRARLSRPEEPGPIYIRSEAPIEKIGFIMAHEYFHAAFSQPCLLAMQTEEDEARANVFARRVVNEMAEQKQREADERWRKRYREISGR